MNAGLSELGNVALSPKHQAILAWAAKSAGGSLPWRRRKLVELQDLLALGQVSGRLEVVYADCREAIKLRVLMRTAVPCLPDPRGELVVADRVHLGITYRQAAVTMPQPGMSYVQVLAPQFVWHPNCSQPAQDLCLGPSLPASTRLREILLLAYGALTLQNVGPGERGHGVMNAAAALWWMANMKRVPLSREPFLTGSESFE